MVLRCRRWRHRNVSSISSNHFALMSRAGLTILSSLVYRWIDDLVSLDSYFVSFQDDVGVNSNEWSWGVLTSGALDRYMIINRSVCRAASFVRLPLTSLLLVGWYCCVSASC